ncbi:MAG: HNH endonuclease [Kiritimatiellae bacterium]|nr:HNH endonuclease [Kiritimatiellia bacterium]
MSSWYQPVDDAHIRRERNRARQLRTSEWWKTQIAKGVCHHCGQHVAPSDLTMDHLIPVARGGTSTKGNVVPACFACNQAKAAQTPAEQILESLGFPDDELPDPADFL